MRRIFVDTSAWEAIADGSDQNHARALLFRDEIASHCELVTSNYVLDELYTLLLMNVGYQQTIHFKRQHHGLVGSYRRCKAAIKTRRLQLLQSA